MDDFLDRGRWLPDSEEDILRGLQEEPPEERSEKRRPPRRGLAGLVGELAPWQRFVLALLLFLNVALLGCMCLVMTGRVVPFSP